MGNSIPRVKLRRGAAMPRLGLGTWPMSDRDAEELIPQALEAGYRLLDTAENYRNEVGVGRAMRASGIPRSELFVTTKFNKEWHGVDLAQRAFEASAKRLGVDYIDLLLIHWPNPAQNRYVDAWKGLLRLLQDGRVRAIGTSNFKPAHLQRLLDETGELPDLNQIQLSPRLRRAEAQAFHAAHGIVTEAWGPLGGGRLSVMEEPKVRDIAARHGKTPAQVVIGWHIQQGLVAIPRSTNPERARQNLGVFDFELTPEDMAALAAFDQGEGAAMDSDRFGH
ncbi:MAG: aldo/keto reductase [Chloroflexi bacterium]|nr:aldo/keto reductase [Chloroflexota bacterium]